MRRAGGILRALGALACSACMTVRVPAQDLLADAYGGVGYDWAYTVLPEGDGGYVMSGPNSSSGAGGYDFWIAKLDASGAISWQKTFGGGLDDIPNSMLRTADGGYILAGRTASFGAGGFDAWILKLDSGGGLVWQKTFGGSGDYDAIYSILQASDGGYFAAGWTNSYGAGGYDYWILRLDSSGDSVWQRTMGGGSSDTAYSACLTPDGGVVVAGGGTVGAGSADCWILKLNSSGACVWQRAFGGKDSDTAFSVRATSDGGYISTGLTWSYGAGKEDLWVLRLDSGGNLLWQRTYGGRFQDWGFSALQTSEGGYLVVGRTTSFGAGNEDAWILKLDPSGTPEWQRTYGGSLLDYAYWACEVPDGSYLVGGVTGSFGAGQYDAMLLKLAPSCLSGVTCPALAATSVTPGAPSPTVTVTALVPGTSSSAPGAPTPTSQDASASASTQCAYSNLPDGDSLVLLATKVGDAPRLRWQNLGGTCAAPAYGIYRGALPISAYDHASLACGLTDVTYLDSSAGGAQYYLVVPHNTYAEGSYGSGFDGYAPTERPAGSSPCKPQCLLTCP